MALKASNPKLKILLILLIGVLLCALIILGRPTVKPPEQVEVLPPGVKVLSANPQLMNTMVTAQGSVIAKRRIQLSARVSGTVDSTNDSFVLGSSFDKGEPLLQIDSLDYANALAQAKSSLAQAEERLAIEKGQGRQAERQWRDLGSADANNLFLRKPQLASAVAAVEAAQSAVKQAQTNLNRTTVKGPFNGRIASILANEGQFVSSNTALAEIYSIDEVQISAPLTAEQLFILSLDDFEGTDNISVEVSAMVGKERRTWPATLVNLDANVDVKSRLYNVVIEVENHANPLLLPGMFVDIQLLSSDQKLQVKIPSVALIEGNKVFLVEDNKLQLKSVQVLSSDLEYAFINGVDAGELLVIERPQWTHVGSDVEVVQP